MDLAAVMDEVAGRLRTIPSLANRTHAHPPDAISPPAAIVSYPDSLDPHGTYNRGIALIKKLAVVVVVGRVSVRAARDKIAAYCHSSGPESVVAVLESGTYTAFGELTVMNIGFDTITIAATDYIAAIFDLDIAGSGT